MNFNQEAFATFAFYGGLLVAKTLVMAFLTARQRVSKGVSWTNRMNCCCRLYVVQ